MQKSFLFSALFISIACGPGLVSGSADVSSYAARASWQWENADHFLVRGRARLEGESQVFSGPFILRASKSIPAVRADFCGPDGSPIISVSLDSLGCLIYYPEEAAAYYFKGGMPAGNGMLDVYAVISMIRTGFPAVPVHWEMVESCDTTLHEESRWYFVSSISESESDTAFVSLRQSDIFPMFDAVDFSLEVTASSWHDEFNAWPMEWRLGSSSVNAIIRIRSYDVQDDPPASAWNLVVPIPIDTVFTAGGYWDYSFDLPIR